MLTKVKDIADVTLGHPFRGSIPEDKDGDIKVIQVRDIDEFGEISYASLVQTVLKGRKTPDLIKKGDVLFITKGLRNIASYVGQDSSGIVASPNFFVLRVKNSAQKTVLPEFLAYQLNQKKAQTYFKKSSEGSRQTSIRRQILEDTLLALPSLEQQQLFIKFKHASVSEEKLLSKLLLNRKNQLEALTQSFWSEKLSSTKTQN